MTIKSILNIFIRKIIKYSEKYSFFILKITIQRKIHRKILLLTIIIINYIYFNSVSIFVFLNYFHKLE